MKHTLSLLFFLWGAQTFAQETNLQESSSTHYLSEESTDDLFESVFLQDRDFLDRATLTVNRPNAEAVVQRTTEQLRPLFERFQFAIKSDTQVTSPKTVEGPMHRPIIKISIKKCVAFVCESAAIDAEITMQTVSGPCQRNWVMEMDLSRSTDNVSRMYQRVLVPVCYMNDRNSSAGVLTIEAHALRGRQFETGFRQETILRFLRNQIPPMVKALQDHLSQLSAWSTEMASN
jgi:hypothetical protein